MVRKFGPQVTFPLYGGSAQAGDQSEDIKFDSKAEFYAGEGLWQSLAGWEACRDGGCVGAEAGCASGRVVASRHWMV